MTDDWAEMPPDAVCGMTGKDMSRLLAEALRLTQEYVGDAVLPRQQGWTWYDALATYDKWRPSPENAATEPRALVGAVDADTTPESRRGPVASDELLTEPERTVIRLMGQVADLLSAIMVDSPSQPGDLDELVFHVHGIRRIIGSQAAARAYPAEFRALSALPHRPASRPLPNPDPGHAD